MIQDPSTAVWFDALFGDCPPDEKVAVTPVGDRGFRKALTFFVRCWELDRAVHIVRADPLNCYVGVATRRPGITQGRGRLADVRHTQVLWADIDFADPGHAAPGSGLKHPADEQACIDLLASVTPPPTMVVSTGGGIHAYWAMTSPLPLDADGKQLTSGWCRRIVALAAPRGLHVDKGIGGAAQVLRPPGSDRSKNGSPPFRCRLADGGPTYQVDDLAALVDEWRSEWETEQATRVPMRPPNTAKVPAASAGGLSPLDALDAVSWADILEPYGYSWAGPSLIDDEPVDLWRRPGGPSSEYSIKTFRNRPLAVAWSSACGLPVGPNQKLTKARVLAHLAGITESELAAGLLREARTKVNAR